MFYCLSFFCAPWLLNNPSSRANILARRRSRFVRFRAAACTCGQHAIILFSTLHPNGSSVASVLFIRMKTTSSPFHPSANLISPSTGFSVYILARPIRAPAADFRFRARGEILLKFHCREGLQREKQETCEKLSSCHPSLFSLCLFTMRETRLSLARLQYFSRFLSSSRRVFSSHRCPLAAEISPSSKNPFPAT